MTRLRNRRCAVALLLILVFAASSQALEITENTNATQLANALLAGGAPGIELTSVQAVLSGNVAGGCASSGTYANASGVYGIPAGIVLSTGRVIDYADGPDACRFLGKSGLFNSDATVAQNQLLKPISGADAHRDITQLTLTFNAQPGVEQISLLAAFGSEENRSGLGVFRDVLAVYLNGVNIALVDGKPITGDNPAMAPIDGTELGAMLAGSTSPLGPCVQVLSGTVKPTGNTLLIIIADTVDRLNDSTVFLSQLGAAVAAQPPLQIAARIENQYQWVYQNTPTGNARHSVNLQISQTSAPVVGEQLSFVISESDGTQDFAIEATDDPMVFRIVGGRMGASAPGPAAHVINVVATGATPDRTASAQVTLQLRPLGDVDGNGAVTTADAIAMGSRLNGDGAGLPERTFDVDGNGHVTTGDLVLLQKCLNGLLGP